MITYEVRYKRLGGLRWIRLRDVRMDGIVFASLPGQQMELRQARFFILADDTRIEVPDAGVIFRFAKERVLAIKDQMSREAGQAIVTER